MFASPFAATAHAAKVVAHESSARPLIELEPRGGYSVSIGGEEGKVRLVAESEQALVVYTAEGIVSTRRLKARFGKLGSVDLRFKTGHRVKRNGPPPGCTGRPEITRHGVFLGRIEFRGESDYIRIDSRRAKGEVTDPKTWRCREKRRPVQQGVVEEAVISLPVIAAFTPHHRAVFGAVGNNKSSKSDISLFVGGTIEGQGSLRIHRVAFSEGDAGSFTFRSDLSGATVKPPKPFRGTATLVRDDRGFTTWSGDLTVVLPGTGPVPLTGPTFTADLSRPKTLAELVDLFGMPGLLR